MAQDIDLSQFHGVFFEECSEAIETIESGLLELERGAVDLAIINDIFRAAHSIKGSAGTFGFTHLAEFTHDIESVFDEMRGSRRDITKSLVTILLEGVDCLRDLIQCCKENKEVDSETMADFARKLSSFLVAEPAIAADSVVVDHDHHDDDHDATTQKTAFSWLISFHPHENMFKSGNDPIFLLKELRNLGDLDIQVVSSRLPDFSELVPEQCYLGWELVLKTDTDREKVEEIFAWVEDNCDLSITAGTDLEASGGDATVTQEKPDFHKRRAADKSPTNQELTTIRVDINKLDELLDLVGKLVITQSMLNRDCANLHREYAESVDDDLEQLERNVDDLREQVMRIRMLPIDSAFQRLPRVVRDVSESLGKKAKLNLSGRSTALDKTVLEKISDPLVHLIRNALSHGIEMPGQRNAMGKNEIGTITVDAYHQGGNVVIEIADDGAGLDTDKILQIAREKNLIEKKGSPSVTEVEEMIFLPGFSTMGVVDDISGRGVGMDVVRRNIIDIGGVIEVHSEAGRGTTFTMRLPLTLAILESQLVRVGGQIYIIPLLSIVESVRMTRQRVKMVAGKIEFFQYQGEYIPIIRLHRVFNIDTEGTSLEDVLLVVCDTGSKRVALYVDGIVGQQPIVIKSLKKNFRQIQGLAGATILGDGSVALIIDLPGLVQCYSDYLMREGISEAELVLE